MSYIIWTALVTIYLAVGVYYARRKWKDIPTCYKYDSKVEANLSRRWDAHYEYPIINARPAITLERYRRGTKTTPEERDHLRVEAYKYSFLFFLWPYFIVTNVLGGYKEAKVGQQVYLLEQSTRQLEKAKKMDERLRKAQEEAQKSIEEALSQGDFK